MKPTLFIVAVLALSHPCAAQAVAENASVGVQRANVPTDTTRPKWRTVAKSANVGAIIGFSLGAAGGLYFASQSGCDCTVGKRYVSGMVWFAGIGGLAGAVSGAVVGVVRLALPIGSPVPSVPLRSLP